MNSSNVFRSETPVYVFFKDKFRSNIESLNNAFRLRYPRFRAGYSYKTNYTAHICREADKLGCFAEVVSPMELYRATSLGVDYENVIYNGVIPDIEGKAKVALGGGIVNVDNLQELIALEEFLLSRNLSGDIGVRLNFDIGNGVVSRFGFDVGGTDYFAMQEVIRKSQCLRLVGVHCHISKARELPFWEKRISRIIHYVQELIDSGCIEDLRYIDLGSNLYGSMDPELAAQFDDNVPTFDDYAEVICKPLYYAFREDPPLLILEPGTPAVANAMGVLATVVGFKKVQGKTFILTDCSKFNLGAIAGVKNVPIVMYASQPGEKVENADFVGYTCIEDDVVYRGYSGNVSVGDKVLFTNVGAYSNTFSPQFIMPTIGMISESGKVLKRRDTFKDVFWRYL